MDKIIKISGLTKEYRLYDKPKDRVKEAFSITGKNTADLLWL